VPFWGKRLIQSRCDSWVRARSDVRARLHPIDPYRIDMVFGRARSVPTSARPCIRHKCSGEKGFSQACRERPLPLEAALAVDPILVGVGSG
jgi:hypothetical protein